jgi:ATP-dependent protease ClpP protease subunit
MDQLRALYERNRNAPRRYEIVGAKSERAEIYLYDAIGGPWGVDASKFAKDLKDIKASRIILRLNSPGGDVFAARAMAQAVASLRQRVTAVVDGLCASAATIVALAASRIEAAPGSYWMIHNPWALTIGDASDHRDMAETLDKIRSDFIVDYAAKTGKPADEIAAWMDDETWFSAAEAAEAGFVDEVQTIAEDNEAAAMWDLSMYAHAPLIFASARSTDSGARPEQPEVKGEGTMPEKTTDIAGQNQAPAPEAVLAAERARIAALTEIATKADLPAEQLAAAIQAGTSVEEFRSFAFEALAQRSRQNDTRSHTPAVTVIRDEADTRRQLMAEAILGRIDSTRYEVKPDNPHRFASCMDMARESLRASGVRVSGLPPDKLAIQAMHTTADFPHVLEAVVNKRLLDSYAAAPSTYQIWCARTTAPDFKTISRPRLGEAPVMLPVPEGAQITMGTMAESKESYAIATYGRGISFTLQMLVNDDLGAFDRIIGAFGQQARVLENKTVYSILTTNPNMSDGVALFHANHGNLGTGVLSNTSLDSMFAAMGTQKGLDGVTVLNIEPRYLIVPKAKEGTARSLMIPTGPNVKASDQNIWAGRLEIVADGNLDASSTAVWYGAADPNILPGIEYAYLTGAEGPQFIRQENANGVLGTTFYCYLHFGAKALDWRPLYKSTGA